MGKKRILSPRSYKAPLVPDAWRHIQISEVLWQRVSLALSIMANTGTGIKREAARKIADQLGCDEWSSAIREIFEELERNGWIFSEVVNLIGTSRVTLIRLSADGAKLCQSIGWSIVEQDWDRLIQHRPGLNYHLYTAQVLEFAYQARLRAWSVLVAPDDEEGDPDLLLYYGDKSIPVHIIGRARPSKKLMMSIKPDNDGMLNLVTARKNTRKSYVSLMRSFGFRGQLCDLETLINDARGYIYEKKDLGSLWLDLI